jgi:hypothetical protein
MLALDQFFMSQGIRGPVHRKIQELENLVIQLKAECDKLRAAQLVLVEDGLRLSQENEALSKELSALKLKKR